MSWIHASWGKFRNWQRTLPEAERLARPQLVGARALWEALQSAGGGDAPEADEQLREDVAELVVTMTDDGKSGARTFASWLRENRGRLSKPVLRAVAESAQTTDKVSVSLTR